VITSRARHLLPFSPLPSRGFSAPKIGPASILDKICDPASAGVAGLAVQYLCEKNAVTHNPMKGVERPKTDSGEGMTPALGDHQARELLAAPQTDTIKSQRDRAILDAAAFLFQPADALLDRRQRLLCPWFGQSFGQPVHLMSAVAV
jgi:hypothetical protein